MGETSVTSRLWQASIAVLFSVLAAAPLAAQEVTHLSSNGDATPEIGPETNLPLPRFVSLKAREANVRRGPSLSHRIDWVFQRKGMPLQVIAEYGHWRRVIDRDGQGGWVHYTMLSGARTVIVEQDTLTLRHRANTQSRETAELERGVIARLRECGDGWCEVTAGGYRGWAPQSVFWGIADGEAIN